MKLHEAHLTVAATARVEVEEPVAVSGLAYLTHTVTCIYHSFIKVYVTITLVCYLHIARGALLYGCRLYCRWTMWGLPLYSEALGSPLLRSSD